MYAQVVESGTTPDRREEMDLIVRTELLPALRKEPGFCGAVNLADPASGNGMMLVFWETAEQASRPHSEYGAAFLEALAGMKEIADGPCRQSSVWEVDARV